jgi:Fe-S-cluster containining protein
MFITITPIEADLIADRMIETCPDILRWVRRLERSAKAMIKQPDRFLYQQLNRPCVFLNNDTKDCNIYDIRPSACRYHVVISPAENCAATERGGEITAVNLIGAEHLIWKFAVEHERYLPSIMPLAILDSLSEKSDSRFISDIRKRLPTVEEWIESYMNDPASLLGVADVEKHYSLDYLRRVMNEEYSVPQDPGPLGT